MRMSEGGGRGAGGKTMAAGRRLLLIYCSLFSLVSMCGFLWVSSSSRGPLSFVMTYDVPESRMTREHTPSADNSSAGRRPQATESVAAFERVLEETTAHTELHTVNKVALPLLPKKDSMPYSGYLKKRVELQKGEWVVKLHSYLLTLNKSVSPHVNMVFGDYKHRRLVLNWITAAVNVIHPPLNNVLVLSLDNLLCELLCNRTLPVACLSVSAGSIFSNELQLGMWLKRLMVRAVLLRVLNYWGYDVASYDSDAVLLKNPQVLYDERPHIDLFSAAGTFPFNVSEKWGFTLCAGTLLYKATPAIEALWKHIASRPNVKDEQNLINNVLVDMKTVWQRRTLRQKLCNTKEGWEGQGENNIRMYVFPAQVFCRAGCCKPRMSSGNMLYCAHPIASKTDMGSKEAVLKKMKAWFLEE